MRAGSSGVVMLASQARGRGSESRPVHSFHADAAVPDLELDFQIRYREARYLPSLSDSVFLTAKPLVFLRVSPLLDHCATSSPVPDAKFLPKFL